MNTLPLSLDANGHALRHRNGGLARLTRQQYAILDALFARPGAIVTRDALLDRLYLGADEPEPRSLDVAISRCRAKIAQAGGGVTIRASWGVGWWVE